jgi:hypothetical protein
VRRIVGLVSAVLIVASAATSATATTGRRSKSPAPPCGLYKSPEYGTLFGVVALSATDAWAVGQYVYDGGLVKHWDGDRWQVVPSPNLGRATIFLGVTAISPMDLWAVGIWQSEDNAQHTLAEHWNGSAWSVVPTPDQGPLYNRLSAVSGTSATDVWAVGDYADADVNWHSLIEHWDGTSWQVVPSPNKFPEYNNLLGVTAISSSDAWAVGYSYRGNDWPTLIEHWDGVEWLIVPTYEPGNENFLYSVDAISSTDLWAVGNLDYDSKTLADHWDGTSWTVVPSRDRRGYNEFGGVAALAADDVWAVGPGPIFAGRTLAQHWDGSAWTPVRTPNPGQRAQMPSVSGAGGLVWAVGEYTDITEVPRVMIQRLCLD